MRTIETYNDLLAEKEELTALLSIQKEFIRRDVKNLREELKPVSEVVGVIGKITTKDKSNPALAFGVDLAGDLLIKNTLLRRRGWLTRMIVPFVFKNLSTHLLSAKKSPSPTNGNFFQRLVDKLKPA